MNARLALYIIGTILIVLSVIENALPEAIGGILAGLLTIFTVAVLSHWRLHRPFNFRFSLDPYRFSPQLVRERKHATHWEIAVNQEAELLLRIMPRKGTHFTRVGVRCVERYFTWRWDILRPRVWAWRNAPTSAIEIRAVRDIDSESINSATHQLGTQFRTWPDGVGGMWGEYHPPYHRTMEDSLWLCVKLVAYRPWTGHISFQGHIDEDHRAYSRRALWAIEQPDVHMASYHCLEA